VSEGDSLERALAAAALGWFNQRLNQAQLADAIEEALRAHGRCVVIPDDVCDLNCGEMRCRKYDSRRAS
jgi:hypothetical protein